MGGGAGIRVGVVGCGFHGRALAEAVARTRSLELVACADPDEAAASRAALVAPDVATYASIEALLDDARVDALLIATPHHVLVPATLAALSQGKHVLLEKPLALTDREATALDGPIANADACFMAGYSMRFSTGRVVRELIDAGAVGEPRLVTGAMCMPPMDRGWLATPETGGGPMLYVGCHLVDMALWYLDDDPVEVFAQTSFRTDSRADETSAFQVRFSRGGAAQCLVTQAAPGFSFEVNVFGAAGKIALRGRNFVQFEVEVLSTALPAYAEPTIIRPLMRRDHITMMLVPELEEFAAAINGKRAPSITMADGHKVLRVLDAATASGKSGYPVAL